MAKNKTITVENFQIVLYSTNNEDFISLTDMAKYRNPERTNYIIQNWMRTHNKPAIAYHLVNMFITGQIIKRNYFYRMKTGCSSYNGIKKSFPLSQILFAGFCYRVISIY